MSEVKIVVSTPNGGVSTQTIPVNTSVRQQLADAGVDVENTTAMVNGEATTLDKILGDGDRLVVARDGKGAA